MQAVLASGKGTSEANVLPGAEGFVQPAKAARMPSREAAT
jgi:hypothetical protein